MAGSCVRAVILYGGPHGSEMVRSVSPHTMLLSDSLSARSLCSSCSLLIHLQFPPRGIPPSLTHTFYLILSLSSALFLLVSFSLLDASLSSCQMSLSSLFSFSSETREPSQMGVLINSRPCVSHSSSERENERMHDQHDSGCCVSQGVLQREGKKNRPLKQLSVERQSSPSLFFCM